MFHVAQLNIAKARYPLDDPRMADFVDAIAAVNTAAEQSEGYVWRLLAGPTSDPPAIIYEDPSYVVNLSVWQSVEALRRFVGSGQHLAIMRRRSEWFERVAAATLVLWWLPAGQVPTVAAAEARLDALRADGPTAAAFNFATTFPAPGAAR